MHGGSETANLKVYLYLPNAQFFQQKKTEPGVPIIKNTGIQDSDVANSLLFQAIEQSQNLSWAAKGVFPCKYRNQ